MKITYLAVATTTTFALVFACGGSAKAPSPPPLPADTKPFAGDVDGGGTTPDAAAPKTTAATPDLRPDAFHVWFRSNDELRVLAGDGALIYGPELTAIVEADTVKITPGPAFGQFHYQDWVPRGPSQKQTEGPGGRWPTAAYFAGMFGNADCRCACPHYLHSWRGNHWETATVRTTGTRKEWQRELGYAPISARYDSRASLGPMSFDAISTVDEHRTLVSASAGCGVDKPSTLLMMRDGAVVPGAPKLSMAYAARAAAWSNGGFFALGGGPLVETWTSADAPGVVTPIFPKGTAPDVHGVKLAARASNDLWVGGTLGAGPFLAHFDGAAWKVVKAPMAKPISSMAGELGGRLYLATDAGEVWSNDPGADWVKVRLPDGVKVYQVSMGTLDGRRDVWIGGDKVVVRNSAPKAERMLKQSPRTMPVGNGDVHPERPLGGALDGCTNYFVPLYEVEDTTDEYAFPLAQKALRGHPEFASMQFGVSTADGRFGGVAGNHDLAKQFAAFAKSNIKNAMPRILCETVAMRAVPMRFDP
jgi:hypothetical protein